MEKQLKGGLDLNRTIEMGMGYVQNLDWEMGLGPFPSGPSKDTLRPISQTKLKVCKLFVLQTSVTRSVNTTFTRSVRLALYIYKTLQNKSEEIETGNSNEAVGICLFYKQL